MIRNTDEGNPLMLERQNALKAFYMSNGYDAESATEAANNGINGMVQLQSFFVGINKIFFTGAIVAVGLAVVLLILWVIRNRRMLFDFFTFKNVADGDLQPETGKV